MTKGIKKLGEILLDKNLLKQEQLKEALEEQVKTKQFLGTILLRRGYLQERQLLEALAEQFQIPYVSLAEKDIDWGLVKKFSPAIILDHKCLPVKKDDFYLTLAITNPLEITGIKKVEDEAMGLKVKLVLITQSEMVLLIEKYKGNKRDEISKLFE